jgi:hypothetical protein
MSATSYNYVKRMEDKESWLTALLQEEPDGAKDAPKLLATAALLRGAVNAIEPPESAQSQARARGLAKLEEAMARRGPEEHPPRAWPSRLGSWLQVAFNLFRRR